MTPTPKTLSTIQVEQKTTQSRISEAELKQEMIKDLTEKKPPNPSGRNSKLARNPSSKLSNYNERKASIKVLPKHTISSQMSEIELDHHISSQLGKKSSQQRIDGSEAIRTSSYLKRRQKNTSTSPAHISSKNKTHMRNENVRQSNMPSVDNYLGKTKPQTVR